MFTFRKNVDVAAGVTAGAEFLAERLAECDVAELRDQVAHLDDEGARAVLAALSDAHTHLAVAAEELARARGLLMTPKELVDLALAMANEDVMDDDD